MKLEVTDIQKGCTHDGPGLRTTVFLKGCPLHCRWCHNPETQRKGKETYYRPDKCIGCFGCWLKTPGRCVIPDAYQCMGERLSRADELVIISKCSFGSYSSKVKNILDRSISYVSPFFVIRKGEMHHRPRYANQLTVSALFYGAEITEEEKETARSLVKANALNLNGQVGSVRFMEEAVW